MLKGATAEASAGLSPLEGQSNDQNCVMGRLVPHVLSVLMVWLTELT